jgi:hypothetical protein
MNPVGCCPLGGKELLDEYFLEHRTRVLDLAAFLDRLERAADGPPWQEHRRRVLVEALAMLVDGAPDRVLRIQMLLSDPDMTPLPALDRKSAVGAYDPAIEEDRR